MKQRIRLVSPLNPEIEYFDLLDMILANILNDAVLSLLEAGRVTLRDKRYLWIRHDVDHDLDKALTMARAESELGYRSTYLLLHTAPYWKNGDKPAIKELVRLEHSIGIHNNALAEWVRNPGDPKPITIIRNAKMRLEDISGMPVRTTSSHGDRLCHEKGFVNYDMWEEAPYRDALNKDLDFPIASLGGLMEAYFVRRDAYLTDTGHKWRGAIKKDIPTHEHFDKVAGAADTVGRFNAMKEGVMQLLVHPCWWEIG
jgi:hypothetical protein